ncbi:Rox3 mediator complex subunit-domain-containing protein [Massariosphaeria phaeospora]|uniref:Mediator of RNA polymerase II transcription subunit 19 n=1 Tax=Massariosphaeria phaeospora TaxID=100035 RepID=A0A7C8M9Q7_9PLEO|nr:Rox3 mediator complex subunit-domain-containing protein [Massariosphaeria phaeospora]
MSNPAAKRQRLTGSFSPASPPYHLAAKTTDQTKPVVQPNTPTSPPHMSVNSQTNGRPTMAATATAAEITPPSSVVMSQHASQWVPSAGNPRPLPTPTSTAGLASSANVDSDGDAVMEDSQDDGEVRLAGDKHSNHDRQSKGIFDEDGKVWAAKGICGDQLFKLCGSTHEVSRPHGSQNLLELYGLNSLARSVARTDPTTGEKINKLRKSYEGHIKALQIAGKPKAVQMDNALSRPLLELLDADYEVLKVNGKEISKALNPAQTALDQNFDSLLGAAFAGTAPGSLPSADTQKYRAYLATEEAVKAKSSVDGLHRAMTPITPATSIPGNSTAASRGPRPGRAGAKRQYTDVSFQGYGEGFTDDYGADSTGGEDNTQGGIAKKRRLAFERTSHQVEVGGARR